MHEFPESRIMSSEKGDAAQTSYVVLYFVYSFYRYML